MTARPDLPPAVLRRLRWPLGLTWCGLLAERVARAFWPAWTVLALALGALMMGAHEAGPLEVVWGALILAIVAFAVFVALGVRKFRWPRRADAMARMDAVMPGRPLAALADSQAVGRGDAASEALWQRHQERMAARAAETRAVEPDLRLSRQDPYGLRYIALLVLMTSLLFGSVLRMGTVGDLAQGDGALVQGPAWEGWIEPPAYTGLPSLYLADQKGTITAPEGSRVTIRFYGEVGALSLSETVSGRTENVGAATDPEQSFTLAQNGELRVNGPGEAAWDVTVVPDRAPEIAFSEEGETTSFDGQMSQPFEVRDDYGVTGGQAVIALDLDAVDRSYGLSADPEPREPIVLDLPLPITGDRAEFAETLVDNLSEHPWAHLPVTVTLEAEDAVGQTGESAAREIRLPARQFFDPLASAIIEMRRDLLWTRDNATRVAQILRAISYRPDDTTFRPRNTYLRLRFILRRLETSLENDALTPEIRDELAQAMWDLAVLIEDGDIGDALERMRQAQERLSEAMRKGATDEEVARLMQELREATEDYLRQKMQQAQRENGADQPQQNGERMELSQQDLQDMMDRIQELMEQGRMAEAQRALEEFQQLMENLQVTQGQQGEGGSEGEQAMEGLADTLREQQGLSDQAFRDLQEQFNPGANAGQSRQNEGSSGGEGRGESHEGQGGRGGGSGVEQGDGSRPQAGEGQGDGTLAERQEALRRELERQRGNLPGVGGEAGEAARDALDRAGEAMRGAEDALRNNDLSEAIDQQSQAMDALREGMRNLGEALAENRSQTPGGQGQAQGREGGQQSDPLGRSPGQGRHAGTQENLLQGEDVYRRARELLDEIRRRSGEGERPEVERDYLRRLLDRF
ncbi:TIGR02302 family protein [Roseovarius sp. SCSIO 43702]|uniref:TIGR02302 family protein n=1 Tax=Roseovarius sp. SCSIO 43702 TaxID=2823043 RepID=UPI001C72F96D|nr:TIGR02302 family protein [Roseovarius sp. SCSIO 43702]QYX57380.1 TIGR02302 family protein [Roseovarius sp. SCSIO 43702]